MEINSTQASSKQHKTQLPTKKEPNETVESNDGVSDTLGEMGYAPGETSSFATVKCQTLHKALFSTI